MLGPALICRRDWFNASPVLFGRDCFEAIRKRIWVIAHRFQKVQIVRAIEVELGLCMFACRHVLKPEMVPEAKRGSVYFFTLKSVFDSFDLVQMTSRR